MTRLIVIAVTSLAAVVVGARIASDGAEQQSAGDQPAARHKAALVVRGPADLPGTKPGTRRVVGEVEARGRRVRLETAESTRGEECLLDIDLETGASGATCSKGGLFAVRKVAFSVNFDGGPERFSSLSIVGLAAPGIASLGLDKSDGSMVTMELDRTRAFVVESPAAELEQGIVPTGLVLFGPSGKRVEEVPLPARR